jgi:outer membrane lipoprotein-sorting protein
MKSLLLSICLLSGSFIGAQTALEIVEKAENNLRGDQSYAEMSMTIVRPNWSRTIRMKSWSRGNDFSLILIQAPARDKGTVFLKKQKEIYNWIPAIERQVKLPPSMMNQSWMGSDFTNDDLVAESSLVKDYHHELIAEVDANGRVAYKIELRPKENAAVIWGKIVLHIDKTDFIHLRTEFYDEEGDLVNIMEAKEVGVLGGKTLPTIVEMEPVGDPGHKTILQYHALDFTVNIPREYFTTQYMKRVR